MNGQEWRPQTAAPSGEAPAAVISPKFPGWVTEIYRALEHIEYLHSAPQPTHQTAFDTTETAPNTSQSMSLESTERKCRR